MYRKFASRMFVSRGVPVDIINPVHFQRFFHYTVFCSEHILQNSPAMKLTISIQTYIHTYTSLLSQKCVLIPSHSPHLPSVSSAPPLLEERQKELCFRVKLSWQKTASLFMKVLFSTVSATTYKISSSTDPDT